MDMLQTLAPRLAAGALAAALLAAAPLAAQTIPLPPPPPPLVQPGSAPSPSVAAAPAAASGARPLSLDEALSLAEANSDQIAVAQAGVMRAQGQRLQAVSQRYPQLSATASYSRALASQFSSLSSGSQDTTTTTGPTNCGKFAPNPSLPVEQRLDSLEHAVDCATNTSPFSSLGSLPFGRENTWSLGLNFSQNLFAGGRIAAQVDAASASRRRAEIQLASTRAQLVLDVAQAYYNAALADRLVSIAEATLGQAEETLRQVTLARQVGNQPEFELLRAQVTRDNQRPQLIQRRADRDLAYTRLRLLLNLSADAPLTLTTPLNDAAPVPVARFASNPDRLGDTTSINRAPVRQLAETIAQQEAQLRVARASSLPTVSLVSNWGRVGYPAGFFPGWNDFSTNWTVGAQLSVPVFTGGRLRGDRMVAEAAVLEARAQFEGTKQLAVLDTRNALLQLAAARAQWQASAGTVEQATRAYQIAEIRYREGLSTQTELTDSRILLQQAQANRAQAARDLQIAQVHVALLPDLPISIGQGTNAAQQQTQTQQQAAPQQAQPQQAQPQTQPQQAANAFSTTGGVP